MESVSSALKCTVSKGLTTGRKLSELDGLDQNRPAFRREHGRGG